MELSEQYMNKLATTRLFSDFTFKVPGGEDHKVHRLVLASQSPVFEKFFEQHEREATLLDLFPNHLHDDYTKLALREAMIDVFTYCYLSSYHNCARDNSKDFDFHVLSHLLTHSLGEYFQIPGLVGFAAKSFKEAFTWYAENTTGDELSAALKKCFDTKFMVESGLNVAMVGLMQDNALEVFKDVIEGHKKGGRFREALDLMEEVPVATARLYSRPTVREDVDEEGSDEEETGEVEEPEERDFEGSAYGREYLTG